MQRGPYSSLCSLIIVLLTLAFIGLALGQQRPSSVALRKWVQPLPKPPVFEPYARKKGVDQYVVTMSWFYHSFHPDLNCTKVLGYGSYPGGTFEAVVNRPINVTFRNQLPEQHIIPTEPLMIGHPVPDSAAVIHLHGGHVPPESDGDPMDWIVRGEERVHYYPNDQLSCTMWYHDHVMTRTRVNVYSGLAGFYLLRDEEEEELELPKGKYEMPLLIQDRIILNTSQLYYPYNWGGFEADTPVVNGKVWPYFEVKPRAYRFRLLNGCNSRYLQVSFGGAGPRIWVIGSDGGFLNKAVEVQNVTMGSGERFDVIIDFSEWAGQNLTLINTAGSPFPTGAPTASFRDLVQFRVATKGFTNPFQMPKFKHLAQLPALPTVENLLAGNTIAKVRQVWLTSGLVTEGNKTVFMMLGSGKRYHDEATETPEVDTTEIWEIINVMTITHPVHIHLTQFRVLQRRPFDGIFTEGKPINYTGPARLPEPEEQGWKDTVRAYPREVVTVVGAFTKYTGHYVWHCHMLEHEDQDMMRPLIVRPKNNCNCSCSPSPSPMPHDH